MGLLSQAVQFGGLYLGLQVGVPAVVAAMVITLNPVATAALSVVLLKQRLGARSIAGIAVGIAAVATACVPRILTHGAALGVGIALVGIDLLGTALGGIYYQRHCTSSDPLSGNAIQLAVASVPTCVIAFSGHPSITDPVRAAWVVTAMVVLSSMVTTTLFVRMVTDYGATATSMLFIVIPSVSALMAWAMLGQRLDAGIVVGLGLGALSLTIFMTQSRSPRASPTAQRVPSIQSQHHLSELQRFSRLR